jgi:rhodanese-related sulfurtransferase
MSRNKLFTTLLALFAAMFLLGACGPATVDEVVAPTEEPAEEAEPTAEPTEAEPTEAPEPTPAELSEETLDAMTADFLGGMEAYNTIRATGLNEALVEGDIFLIDVREPAEIEENGYIEGAINIPIRDLFADTSILPSTDTPIVVYCAAGTRATLGMTGLGLLGYEDVRTFIGGSFGAWVDEGYPVAEGMPPAPETLDAIDPDPALVEQLNEAYTALPDGFAQIQPEALNEALIEEDDLILLDVRRPNEVEENGAIEGSTLVTLEDMVELKDEWPPTDANIVIYCKAGTRGNIAMAILRSYGYENVRNLSSGFDGWVEAGLPAVGGFNLDENAQDFLDGMEAYNTIRATALNELLIENPDVFLLDVREPSEIEENGYIEGAVNIPIRSIGQNLDKLPSLDTTVVVYCAAGTRATLGMTGLGLLGYEDVSTFIAGSFGAWVEEGYPVAEGMPPEPEVLNALDVSPALANTVDQMFQGLPDGFAQIRAEGLNEALIEEDDLILLDVRRAEEVEEVGIIEGATVVTLEEMVELKDAWPAPDANIVVYCKAGTRGNIAMAILRSYGYENIRNLAGGIDGWTDAGFPVVPQ